MPSQDSHSCDREVMRSGQSPLVTVVIAVHDAGRFLRPAVQSVLDQSHEQLEIIIVDEGSTDGCMDTIADLDDERILILSQERAGKAAALNKALGIARGQFYAIQDADDLSHELRLEKQLQCMAANPEVAAVFCGFNLILNDRQVAPLCPAKSVDECRRDIDAFRMPGHDPTAMYRIALIKDLRYDENFTIGQGFDYVLRVGEALPMAVVGECLYSYRVGYMSHSRRDPELRESMVRRILERACERRGTPESDFPERLKRPQARLVRARDLDNNLAAHFMESTLDLRRAGRFREAFRTAWTCACMHPLDPHYLKALVYCVSPRWALKFLRRRNRS